MENLLHFAIIMLILSLASERLANFLKLQLHQRSIRVFGVLIWLFKIESEHDNRVQIFKNLRVPENNRAKEKNRESDIAGISLVMGIMTAIIFHIDLFQIIRSEKLNEALNSNSYHDWLAINFPDKVSGYELQIEFTLLFLFIFLALCWSTTIFHSIRETILNNKSSIDNGRGIKWENIDNSRLKIFIFILMGLFFTCIMLDITSECTGGSCPENTFRLSPKFLGILFAGFAISLGSKFWHELVDLLYYFRSAKQNIIKAEGILQQANSPEALIRHLEVDKFELVRTYRDYLISKEIPYRSIGISNHESSGWVVELTVPDEVIRDEAEHKINMEGFVSNGISYDPFNYPLIIISIEGIIETANFIQSGEIISLEKHPERKGTLGAFLEHMGSGKVSFFTCFHVVQPDKSRTDFSRAGDGPCIVDVGADVKGKLRIGGIMNKADYAFVDIEEKGRLENQYSIKDITKADKHRRVYYQAEYNHGQEKMEERIRSIMVDARIGYDFNIGGERHIPKLEGLFRISHRHLGNNKHATQVKRGDSGALVFNQDNEAIGMIVGRSDEYGYVIPLKNFIRKDRYRLYTKFFTQNIIQ